MSDRIDPDDAPLLTKDFFDSASVREGGAGRQSRMNEMLRKAVGV